MELLKTTTLPINKEALKFAITHNLGVEPQEAYVENRAFKVLEDYMLSFEIKNKHNDLVTTYELRFREILPNTLVLLYFEINGGSKLSKKENEIAESALNNWFISGVFEKNPSGLQEIKKIEAYHLNGKRAQQHRNDTSNAHIYYNISLDGMEPLMTYKSKFSDGTEITKRLFFHDGFVYSQGVDEISVTEVKYFKDKKGEVYRQLFEWDGKTRLRIFDFYKDSSNASIWDCPKLKSHNNGLKDIDFVQLLTLNNQPVDSKKLVLSNDKKRTIITAHSEKIFITRGISKFKKGDVVEYASQCYYVAKVLDNEHYLLFSELYPFSEMKKKKFLTKPIPFSELQLWDAPEPFVSNGKAGLYLVVFKDDSYKIELIKEEHPNYYFVHRDKASTNLESIRKSEVRAVFPTFEDAEQAIANLMREDEKELLEVLKNGSSRSHKMLLYFFEEIGTDKEKEKIVAQCKKFTGDSSSEIPQNVIRRALNIAVSDL